MFKIRLGTKQKQRSFQTYLNRVQEAQGAVLMQDAVMHIQEGIKKQSPIIQPPSGLVLPS